MNEKLASIVVFLFMLISLIGASPIHGQSPVKSLTLVYSNNINGEIDPCPT